MVIKKQLIQKQSLLLKAGGKLLRAGSKEKVS